MRIALGSTSESKVAATRAVVARVFPNAIVEAVPVPSTVPAQPISDEQTIQGALQRAEVARRQQDADLGVGIEGGVHQDARGVWVCAWVAIVNRIGREGLSCAVRFRLPPWMAARAVSGEELGAIVDTYLGTENAHEALGAIGLLTRGLVDRQAALEQAIAAALVPFLSTEHFEAKHGG